MAHIIAKTLIASAATVAGLLAAGTAQASAVEISRAADTYGVDVGAADVQVSDSLQYKVTARVIFEITLLEGAACEELTNGDCPLGAN